MKSLYFVSLVLLSQIAHAGNELGNGGDFFAQEFVSTGREIVEELKANPDSRISHRQALADAVENATVRSKATVMLGEEEVDAVNFPSQQKIELSRTRWAAYSPAQKRSLALHEYLGLAGENDGHYQISGNYHAASSKFSASKLKLSEENGIPTELKSDLPTKKFSGFSLGLGAGSSYFNGSIGKLYKATSPSLNARLGYFISRESELLLGFEYSSFAYASTDTGNVVVNLLTPKLGYRFHFNPDAGNMDPYLGASIAKVKRSQVLNDISGQVVEDGAFGYEASAGLLFGITKRTKLWLQANFGQDYFPDRYSAMFAADGIEDTTGQRYGADAGMVVAF